MPKEGNAVLIRGDLKTGKMYDGRCNFATFMEKAKGRWYRVEEVRNTPWGMRYSLENVMGNFSVSMFAEVW